MIKNAEIKNADLRAEPLIVLGFHALSEPLRVGILELLRDQELCVCDLSDRLGMAQSKLSFHLKTLKDANLVMSRQDRKWIYYRLNLAQFLALEEYIATFRRFGQIPSLRNCLTNPVGELSDCS
jgi:ArsR family transcriptional regulator, arsenate/arsenite/antimonite-responsive transcriptional repressor